MELPHKLEVVLVQSINRIKTIFVKRTGKIWDVGEHQGWGDVIVMKGVSFR